MQTVIIVVHLMIVLAMVGLVLLQKSEGGGLGMGGGGNFMSNRGASNVLTRATAILAALFFATSLILSILAGYSRNPRSLLDGAGRPVSGEPAVPGAPSSGSPGGLIDQLRGGGAQPAPAAPAAPSGPQVPRSQ
jgi:preprotein translocase subunit SecG